MSEKELSAEMREHLEQYHWRHREGDCRVCGGTGKDSNIMLPTKPPQYPACLVCNGTGKEPR